ncbi:DUF1330 domain-containing protein [Stenotrophomonas sp. NPDC087984]
MHPRWGCRRIQGELARLRYQISAGQTTTHPTDTHPYSSRCEPPARGRGFGQGYQFGVRFSISPISQPGGHMVAASNTPDVAEGHGEPDTNLANLELPTMDRAHERYHSPEYDGGTQDRANRNEPTPGLPEGLPQQQLKSPTLPPHHTHKGDRTTSTRIQTDRPGSDAEIPQQALHDENGLRTLLGCPSVCASCSSSGWRRFPPLSWRSRFSDRRPEGRRSGSGADA